MEAQLFAHAKVMATIWHSLSNYWHILPAHICRIESHRIRFLESSSTYCLQTCYWIRKLHLSFQLLSRGRFQRPRIVHSNANPASSSPSNSYKTNSNTLCWRKYVSEAIKPKEVITGASSERESHRGCMKTSVRFGPTKGHGGSDCRYISRQLPYLLWGGCEVMYATLFISTSFGGNRL